MKPAPVVWLFAFVLLHAGATHADRLHLASGGVIDVDSWWVEGRTLHYRNGAGTVGLPRSIVIRIDESSPSDTAPPVVPAPQPVRESSPPAESVAARMAEGRTALEARKFREAADHFQFVMSRIGPEVVAPYVGYAISMLALGEDRMAESVVLEGLARHPDEAMLLELLGDVRNREERVVDALESWRRAERAEPKERRREKIEKAERELAAGRDYDLSTTAHFNVRFDGDVDAALGSQVMEFLETRFWELVELFDHTPRQPITVLLYPTRQFRSVTGSAEWVGGVYDGKIRVPLGGVNRLDPASRGLLTHELTHAFVHVKSRGVCPRWLHEGLAQHVAGQRPTRGALSRIKETLAAVEPARWEDRGFSYETALSLTTYLESLRGFPGIVDMLALLGQGRSLDDALDEIYGLTYARLCDDWAREIHR